MKETIKIKKVNIIKFATTLAVVYGIMSSILFFIIGVFGLFINHQPNTLLMSFIMPFIYTFAGFISGLFLSSTYNIVTKWIGGIELEIEKEKEKDIISEKETIEEK